MSLSDFVIIYLALGAPSAVCHFFEDSGRSRAQTWIRTLGVFLIWPTKTFMILRRQLRRSSNSTQFSRLCDLDSSVAVIQEEILNSIKAFAPADEIFDLRDIVQCYVELTRAAGESSRGIAEIFQVAGRTDSEIGTICLNRRNAARLARHQIDAGRSLLAAVGRAESSTPIPPATIETAADLAALLGDTTTEKSLREIARRQNTWTEPVGESWKSEPSYKPTERSAIQFSQTTTASAND